jgi:hypothetical protein
MELLDISCLSINSANVTLASFGENDAKKWTSRRGCNGRKTPPKHLFSGSHAMTDAFVPTGKTV